MIVMPLYGLGLLLGLGALICFIMVLIQMFQRGNTGLGVACIVLTVVCGIGPLIVFIYGWMNATEWGIKNVMLVWTGIIVLGFVLGAAFGVMAPGLLPVMPMHPPIR